MSVFGAQLIADPYKSWLNHLGKDNKRSTHMTDFTRLTDEDCVAAVAALVDHGGNKSKTALSLGFSRRTLDRRVEKYYSRNLDKRYPIDIPDGMEIFKVAQTVNSNGEVTSTSIRTRQTQEGTFEVPKGHVVKGVSTLLDSQGNVVQEWVKTKEGEYDPLLMAQMLKDVFQDFQGPVFPNYEPEKKRSGDLLTLYPLPDMHLGLFAWKGESGEDWDLSIALQKYEQAMRRVNYSSTESQRCVVLGGGDFLHADNSENRTLKSGNVLDVDTRYAKVFEKGAELLIYQIELAKKKHNEVLVRILPGNHDEHSAVALTWFLHAWFRNDPVVTVDTDPSVFWYLEFGRTMLAATHGHAAKLTEMPQIMAGRMPEMWGRTIHRYAHGFHIHHKTRYDIEAGSVIMETHQAPTPQDHYHFSKGYLAGRSMTSITYDIEVGEVSRTKVVL